MTCNGLGFDLANPEAEIGKRPLCVLGREIAHGLACTNRWHGQTREPVNVALHSLNCAEVALATGREAVALECLLHDAAEAWYGDRARPMKAMERAEEYRRPTVHAIMHDLCLEAIAGRFGLVWPLPAAVQEIDDQVLAAEFHQWGVGEASEYGLGPPEVGIRGVPHGWQTSKAKWLTMLERLMAGRGSTAEGGCATQKHGEGR